MNSKSFTSLKSLPLINYGPIFHIRTVCNFFLHRFITDCFVEPNFDYLTVRIRVLALLIRVDLLNLFFIFRKLFRAHSLIGPSLLLIMNGVIDSQALAA